MSDLKPRSPDYKDVIENPDGTKTSYSVWVSDYKLQLYISEFKDGKWEVTKQISIPRNKYIKRRAGL